MNIAAWEHVWQSAVTLFVQEPVQFRVLVTLGGAFLALMVLEGLRASFMPHRTERRTKSVTEASSAGLPHVTEPPQLSASTKIFAALPYAPPPDRRAQMRGYVQHNPKREITRPRAHRNMLPKIRRVVTASDADSRSG